MRKYPPERIVTAIYDDELCDNPFLSAMPTMLSWPELKNMVGSFPLMPHTLSQKSDVERRQLLPMLSTIFIPMHYMYVVYDQLYRAIMTTYSTRTAVDSIRDANILFRGGVPANYTTQADTGSVLGVPGIGKTSTIQRCLGVMPQVIDHKMFRGQPFYCKQVLYLHVECPSDCSVKTLAFNLVMALDRAIGSDYFGRLYGLRSSAASAVATQIKILCMTHHVGLILVDEIQNAVLTARQKRQVKPLIKFLVELTNDTCTAVYFVGTPMAEELFLSQEHLKRRTRGVRLLPMKPDGNYRRFLEQIWQYQVTPQSAQLTDKLANKLYDYSGGIPAYILKIFQATQAQALIQGESCLDDKVMQRAIDILHIKIPKTFSGGTYISDFEVIHDSPVIPQILHENTVEPMEDVPRLYANKRGRKAIQRDNSDLLVAYQKGCELIEYLQKNDLLEVIRRC